MNYLLVWFTGEKGVFEPKRTPICKGSKTRSPLWFGSAPNCKTAITKNNRKHFFTMWLKDASSVS